MVCSRINELTRSILSNCVSDGIALKHVTVHPTSVRANLKDVEDKLSQLVREVGKLQEQLTVISSQTNGNIGTESSTIHM